MENVSLSIVFYCSRYPIHRCTLPASAKIKAVLAVAGILLLLQAVLGIKDFINKNMSISTAI